MPVLTSLQRKSLEDACTKGRHASEQAVRAVLISLAVTAERPPAHLNETERQLRRGLRAKARQLGDRGEDLELLTAECAYEQWHRLLFARFLAEINLLIHPDYGAPVTVEDCDELAESLEEPDGWSVAARFAAEILPGIFRLDDPCVRLRLAPEGRLALEGILSSVPKAVFAADDALGWVYQYWQKNRKSEVSAAERKIGGADLGPVTQLFTENYMVRFLLENSLGAWWAARHPDSPLVQRFAYLRLDGDGQPAAGRFDTWPNRVADVTVMDPCCGSGHFLVEAFSMLWRMRAEEDGMSVISAQDAVLRENLFGLELDPRCVQIAMFAVALHAWKEGEGWRQLPVPNIACSGIPVTAPVEEWRTLAGGDERVENSLVRLHVLFRDADSLGSLIDPRSATEIGDHSRHRQTSFEDVDWDTLSARFESLVASETADPATAVLGAEAAGIGRAASFLARSYTLVATNPPFLGRPKMSQNLMTFTERYFDTARHDLATVMLDRWRRRSTTAAFVTPQGWLFQPRWKAFREHMLRSTTFSVVVWLGESAFESDAAAGAFAAMQVIGSSLPSRDSSFVGIDCDEETTPAAKAGLLRTLPLVRLIQVQQRNNPDERILLSVSDLPLLGDVADSYQGIKTCDNPRFAFSFWELPALLDGWVRVQSAPDSTAEFRGRSEIIYWEDGEGEITRVCQPGSTFRGDSAWGQAGVTVAEMRSLHRTLYSGEIFDGTATVIVPKNESDMGALWHFACSPEFVSAVRSVDRKLSVATSTLVKVPFDVERWRKVAIEAGPLPKPWSNDPTQWLFSGRPEESTAPLQVALARILGYRWLEQPGPDDFDAFRDADGIVCLPSVVGEPPAADRLQLLLASAFGESWSPTKQTKLLQAAGSKKHNLGDWLRDDFFRQHCALFADRPFIWHVWDGRTDGFSALVNYHRLDLRTLEKLTYTYLGDWIERQRAEVREQKVGAEARLAAAAMLRTSLERILEGEPPYDIYVRWKSLAEQPIGWEPDINDGVRVNVRPFVEAGVLRSSFNIKWRKDRGTNPDGSERLNDLHFTSDEKRAARKVSS
jgi:hypothetical protein